MYFLLMLKLKVPCVTCSSSWLISMGKNPEPPLENPLKMFWKEIQGASGMLTAITFLQPTLHKVYPNSNNVPGKGDYFVASLFSEQASICQ